MIYRLTIYEADDVTSWIQVSTDPTDTSPWMMVPERWANSEIDFVSGSASIGEIVIEVLDPQTGGSQAQRGFTEKLADNTGRSAMSGRRALVEDSKDGSTFRTIFDGVINRVELSDSLSSFFISIRDIRERERDVELFRFTETCSVLPAGVLNGYGIPYAEAPTTEWLVPPTAPVTGVFRLNPSQLFGEGFVDLSEYVIGNTSDGVPIVRSEVVMSDAAIAASASTGENPRIRVLWRAEGSTGSYTTVNVGSFVQAAGTFVETIGAWVGSEDGRPVNAASRVAMPNGFGLANTLPGNGDRVEIIVQYIGETSEDWPLHIEEVTAGELIRDIYEGDYSEEDPRVRFDETSILALNTPVRARITGPVTDAREWVERNLYVAAGAAPAIIDGVVHAVTYELPDTNATVTEIGNAEADVLPGWAQTTDDAVNVVEVTYPRDRSVAPDEPGYQSAPGDRIVSREVIIDTRVPESISLIGEKRQAVKVDVLRAIGGPQGEPYSGDVADETGAQVAKKIAALMADRFALGGQTFVVRVDRTDATMEALKVGDWAIVNTTWTPDYQTGDRGGNRLGQIVARRDDSPIRCELVIQDAGPDAQPLVAPTLGSITQTGISEVVVPIATVPTGAEARVDYAISTTQPTAGSSLWTFAGRSAASASVTTPQLPSGKKIWIRARSEAPGRRPSGYTTPTSIDLDQRVQLRKIFAYDAPSGVEVYWVGNPLVAGVRVEYVAHPFGEAPDYSAGDTQDSDTSPVTITDTFDRLPNEVLSFRVTPYPTFSGGSVSGTPGQPLEGSIFIGIPTDIPFGNLVAFRTGLDLEFQAQGNSVSQGGKWVVRLDDPPEAPDDPLAEDTGSFEGPFDIQELTLLSAPSYGEVWVAVYFFDDYDDSLGEPTGKRGPRVLARAREQADPVARDPDVQIIEAEVGIFDVGTGADFDNRQVALRVEISDEVKSLKVLWNEATDPSPTAAIFGDNTFDIAAPGTRQTLFFYVGGTPSSSDNAVQFPLDYPVDTIVTVQAYSDTGGSTGFLQDARYRFGPNTGLPVIRTVKSTTEVQGSQLVIGSGLSLTTVSSNPSIAVDSSTLATVPVSSGGTGRDILTANSVVVGDGINQVKLVTATTNGKVLGVQSGQWAEIDAGGTITGVTAGSGLDGGGSSGTVTLNVTPYSGFTAGYGKTEIVSDSVAVVLGTAANEAMPGNTTIPQGTVTSVSGGDGLTGTVTSSGSINMGTPSTISDTTSNSTTSTSHTHALDGAIADVTVSGAAPTGTPARAGSLHFVV